MRNMARVGDLKFHWRMVKKPDVAEEDTDFDGKPANRPNQNSKEDHGSAIDAYINKEDANWPSRMTTSAPPS